MASSVSSGQPLRSVIERRLIASSHGGGLVVTAVTYTDAGFDRADLFAALSLLTGAPTWEVMDDREVRAALRVMHETDVVDRLRATTDSFFREEIPSERRLAMPRELDVPKPADTAGFLDRVLLSSFDQQRAPGASQFVFQQIVEMAIDQERELQSTLAVNGVRPQVFITTLWLVSAGSQSPRRSGLLRGLHEAEIPLAQSPEIKSETLSSVVQQAKQFVVAPIYMGGLISAGALMSGHYVTAFESAAAGAGSTLILVGGVSVADRLARLLER